MIFVFWIDAVQHFNCVPLFGSILFYFSHIVFLIGPALRQAGRQKKIFSSQIAFSVVPSSGQAVLVFSEFLFQTLAPKKRKQRFLEVRRQVGFQRGRLEYFRLCILRPSNIGIFRFPFQHVARKFCSPKITSSET